MAPLLNSPKATVFTAIVLIALLVRSIVGLHSYSGMGNPPKYGDYEAQRHWMEITTNLPPSDCLFLNQKQVVHSFYLSRYRQTPDNDLTYWGLDYPPLSAYQSWLHGKMVAWVEPEALSLHSSRGYETQSSKLAMRYTVLLSDALCYLPAALAATFVFGSGGTLEQQALLLAGLLLGPSLILIDHGHFQYNCIGLGAAAGAAAAVVAGYEALGSVLFCLSLNHKQMGLYYAPAFFAYLLGRCLQRRTLRGKVASLAKIGLTVIATFAVVWWPFLGSLESVTAVLGRLFPTQRGLYEDYVANFWCASSRLIKWRSLLSTAQLVRACAAATLAALLPSMASQLLRPSPKGFALCMANSAMAFFLFSYQVHEKSILLPLLPLTLLTVLDDARTVAWVQLLAPFSMFPLLKKDGLVLAYLGAVPLYWAATVLAPAAAHALLATAPAQPMQAGQRRAPEGRASTSSSVSASSTGGPEQASTAVRAARLYGPRLTLLGVAVLHAADALWPPPDRYPYLHDAAMTTWSFLHFALLFLYTNAQQWREFKHCGRSKSKAKQL